MLRHLAIAICIVVLAGAGAFVLVVGWPMGGPDRVTEAAQGPDGPEAAAPTMVPTELSGIASEDSQAAASLPDHVPQSDEPRAVPPRDVTPPGIRSGPVRRYDPPPRREAAETEEAPSETIESRSFPRVVVEGAGVLRAGDRRIRLAGLSAPEPDATCGGSAGEEWPCGRAAMAALRLLVRNRTLECDILGDEDEVMSARCKVGGRDLGAWLVEQGWAEPVDEALYGTQFTVAREEARGMFAATRGTAPPPVRVPSP